MMLTGTKAMILAGSMVASGGAMYLAYNYDKMSFGSSTQYTQQETQQINEDELLPMVQESCKKTMNEEIGRAIGDNQVLKYMTDSDKAAYTLKVSITYNTFYGHCVHHYMENLEYPNDTSMSKVLKDFTEETGGISHN
ncbi:hypothetical protein [Helicobacter sp. T3_23-1059]